MKIESFAQAKNWFEQHNVPLYGLLRRGGDHLPISLAGLAAANEEAAKTVRGIGEVLYSLYRTRGSHFVASHAVPLILRQSKTCESDPAHAASLLLSDLRHLQRRVSAVTLSSISDVPSEKLSEVGEAYTRLVNQQQFFDPEAYGSHYHKDVEHAVRKEAVVGKAGAELHGNVLLGKQGAFALIGDPRVGKGRVSFLLSYLHGLSLIADDRVHLLFSTKGAHVVGPYRKYGFRAASQFYSRGRMFHQGVFGSPESPDFPQEVKQVFWLHGSNRELLFKGKPTPSVKNAPLHDNLKPALLKAVFLLEAHNAPRTTVQQVNPEHVAQYLAKREDVGVPTVFGYPQTYPLQTKLAPEERLQLSRLVVSKLSQKGVRFYSVRVPPDPEKIPRSLPSRDVRRGTPFDNRASAAEQIARMIG